MLEGESGATSNGGSHYNHRTENTFSGTITSRSGLDTSTHPETSPISDDTAIGGGFLASQPRTDFHRATSYDHSELFDSPPKNDDQERFQRIPVHDQRTVLITNLSDRTTHKDLAGIIRGGRLLDIFLRNDRSATVSFVEGAAEFLAYAKRNDLYLQTKRVSMNYIC